MPGPSPFADDWRECLGTHYQYTIRNQDAVTERTLTDVMRRVGFSDQQLAELRVLATMRAEEMPPDYVPDMELLTTLAQAENVPPLENFQIVVPEMPEEDVIIEDVIPEEIVTEIEILEQVEDEPESEPEPPKAADGPVQYSMF